MRTVLMWVVTVVVGLTALDASGQVQDRSDRHRVPADFMSFRGAQWLERDERVEEEQPDLVLDAMALEPGDVVADIGCGSGYYARRIARRVAPGGRVYCVDIQQEMLDIMRQLAAEEGVEGIEPVLGAPDDPRLPAGEVDWIILADVYHEMSDYEAMLAGMRAALAPGGQVALLEYRVEDGTGDHLKSDHAMSVRQVLAEWLPAGFELADLHEFLPGQHLFFMRAAGDATMAGAPVRAVDLRETVEAGLVEVSARGGGDRAVTLGIRNLSDDRLVVTMPAGARFTGDGETREMVSRRDAAIRLFDREPRTWTVRAVGRQHARPAPGDRQPLAIVPPGSTPALAELMYAMQVGTYQVADSPLLYLPRLHVLEQAAVWIAEEDLSYEALEPAVADERMPAQYAVAFALVYCDLAGIDVTRRRVWEDRERIFGVLRDPGLTAWYQIATSR